jgi:valyl-tRNA synthetase
MPKNFDPTTSEESIYSWWEASGLFSPKESTNSEQSKPFVIVMPPPNVTGGLHMGHAIGTTIEDILIRFHRMRGRPTLWLPGTDHAGIATQLLVERALNAEGKSRAEVGREAFLDRIWRWKNEKGGYITKQLRKLGASADWSREKFTLSPDHSKAVTEAFIRLHDAGLIYRGSYMVNWSPAVQTAVSDLEVEFSEEPGRLFYLKYPLAEEASDTESFLPVATTRPETILGDTALCVHPEDKRYQQYIGMHALVPFVGRKIPIIADAHVDRDFGTGVLKITPGHDRNDYDIGKLHGLPIVTVIGKDGRIVPYGGEDGRYVGLDRFECREKLWADLQDAGLAIKSEPYEMRVPRSQRGGEIIEPLVSTQWFVRTKPLADKALEAVKQGRIRILPERFEKIYFQWLENIQDWCISRQLWWGHRIPVYYVNGDERNYIVARSVEEAHEIARSLAGDDSVLEQDPDVLDTW